MKCSVEVQEIHVAYLMGEGGRWLWPFRNKYHVVFVLNGLMHLKMVWPLHLHKVKTNCFCLSACSVGKWGLFFSLVRSKWWFSPPLQKSWICPPEIQHREIDLHLFQHDFKRSINALYLENGITACGTASRTAFKWSKLDPYWFLQILGQSLKSH